MPTQVKNQAILSGPRKGYRVYEYTDVNYHGNDYNELKKLHEGADIVRKSNGNLQLYVKIPKVPNRGLHNTKREREDRSTHAGQPRKAKSSERLKSIFGEGPIPEWTSGKTKEARKDEEKKAAEEQALSPDNGDEKISGAEVNGDE